MFNNKKYAGVALESDAFKVAQVEPGSNGLKLRKIDRFSLVERLDHSKETVFDSGNEYTASSDASEEEVFGFDEEDIEEQDKEEVDFSELEAQADNKEIFELGAMDDENKPKSNFVLLHNILSRIDNKRIDLGINIPAGNTIFQIIEDAHYGDVEEDEIVERVEDKLLAIYGSEKSSDFYSYEVRDDGSIVVASVDESPALLHIVDEVKEFYRGKLKIQEVYPDEVALIGLYRSNYEPHDNEITALLQFGPTSCRIIFLKGEEILTVPSPIAEGTESNNFLNLLFSKILFQLDSGEVPQLNNIVIANNTLGEKAITFFRENFSGVNIDEFKYKDSFLDKGRFDEDAVAPFTTAIAIAVAAAQKDEQYPALSLMPAYVQERQKIFKLRWHGMLLLFLIFITFPVANYFYKQNERDIDALSTELQRTNAQIEQIQPTVNQAVEVSENLTLLTSKLGVLDSLSNGSKAWSARLDILNRQMSNIPNTWITSMSKTQEGTFIEGYSLYRNRIPAIVDIFDQATLLSVNTEVTREKELYKFSMIVQEFTADSSMYSPEKPERIEQILNN